MRQRYFIDTHKVATGAAVLGMMAWQSSWNDPTAWIYLALHGTYGLLWVWKSASFPDKSWEERCTVVYGLVIWAGLSLLLEERDWGAQLHSRHRREVDGGGPIPYPG